MTFIDYMIIAVLAVAVFGIIAYLVKEKRQGKTGCGCGCGGCPHANACASAKAEKPTDAPVEQPTQTDDGLF